MKLYFRNFNFKAQNEYPKFKNHSIHFHRSNKIAWRRSNSQVTVYCNTRTLVNKRRTPMKLVFTPKTKWTKYPFHHRLPQLDTTINLYSITIPLSIHLSPHVAPSLYIYTKMRGQCLSCKQTLSQSQRRHSITFVRANNPL